jgi:hypothetical protein
LIGLVLNRSVEIESSSPGAKAFKLGEVDKLDAFLCGSSIRPIVFILVKVRLTVSIVTPGKSPMSVRVMARELAAARPHVHHGRA